MNDGASNVKILVRIRGSDPQNSMPNINTMESLNNLDKTTYNTRTSPLNLHRNKTSNPAVRSATLTRSKSPTNTSKIK
jgi:hypothetical protein